MSEALGPTFQHGSPSAKALARHLRDRIEGLQVQLEMPQDEPRTAALRGRIAEARALLALVAPPPAEDPEDHMDAGNIYA